MDIEKIATKLHKVYMPNCTDCSYGELDIKAVKSVVQPEFEQLEADNRRLEEEIKEWRDALQELCDWQNGPPLIRDEESWQKAMDEASRLLTKP